jgi:hypothetical protein
MKPFDVMIQVRIWTFLFIWVFVPMLYLFLKYAV